MSLIFIPTPEQRESNIFPSVMGIEGYDATTASIHFDVNGKWGGKQAVVVHFYPNGDTDRYAEDARSFLYLCIGNYYKAGRFPDEDRSIPSRYQTAKLLIDKMQGGCDMQQMYDAIKAVA